MSDLSPEAAALLEAARGSHGPDERDRERVLSSLHVSLGIAVPLVAATSIAHAAQAVNESVLQSGVQSSLQTSLAQGAAQGTAQATAQATAQVAAASGKSAFGLGAKLLTWKAGKILLATVALGSAVGVTAVQRATRVETDATTVRSTRAIARGRSVDQAHGRPGDTSPTERTVVDEPHVEATPAVAVAPQAPVSREAPAVVEAEARETPSMQSRASKPHHSRHGSRVRSSHATVATSKTRVGKTRGEPATTPEPVVNEPVPPAVASVAVQPATETELIRKVLTSLRDHDEAGALSLLDEHAARYPNGAFATERRGLHVVALCAAGRISEGKSEQKAFLKQAGKAPIAARVRSACGEPKP